MCIRDRYRPKDLDWRTAWKHILEHHDEDFASSFFCFKFPLHPKVFPSNTPRQHGKLRQKIIRELKRKIKDVNQYMSQSLHDLKKTKRRNDKRAQRQAQTIRDTKQDADRARFRQQAEAEIEAAYSHTTLSPTDQAIHLEIERKATKQRGDDFESWQKESSKKERNRFLTAATDAKKQSVKLKSKEHSRLRLEADRTTSQDNRLKKKQQVSSSHHNVNPRKHQINTYQTRQNQLHQISEQKTQRQTVKYNQHLEKKRASEEETQIQTVATKKAIEKLRRPTHRLPRKQHPEKERDPDKRKKQPLWTQITDSVCGTWYNPPVTHFVKQKIDSLFGDGWHK